MTVKPRPGGLISCVDPDTDEEVGVPHWAEPGSQFDISALEACGRKRFHKEAEGRKLGRIADKLNNG